MICVKCGQQIPDDANFCPNCQTAVIAGQEGSTTNQEQSAVDFSNQVYTPPQANIYTEPMQSSPAPLTFAQAEPTPVKSGMPKFVIPVVASVLIIAGIISALFLLPRNNDDNTNNGKIAADAKGRAANDSGLMAALQKRSSSPFFNAIIKTSEYYDSELAAFSDNNAVLSQLKSNLAGSYTLNIDMDGMIMAITNDVNNNTFAITVDSGGMLPGNLQAFLTDTRLIVGIDGMFNIEVDPKNIGNDILAFAGSSADPFGDESITQIAKMLEGFDFSYTGLTNMFASYSNTPAAFDGVAERYIDVIDKLTQKAEYTEDPQTLDFSGDPKETLMMMYTIDADVLSAWLKEDLLPVLKKETVVQDLLREYYDAFNGSFASLLGAMGETLDIEELIREFEAEYNDAIYDFESEIDDFITEMRDEGGLLILKMNTLDNVIVRLEFVVSTAYDGEVGSVVISAIGSDYRLNNIIMQIIEGGEIESEFTMEGSLIGRDIIDIFMTSASYWDDYEYKETSRLTWDTNGFRNNFRVTDNYGYTEELTFAVSGNDVVFGYDDGWSAFEFRLSPFTGSINLPSDTLLLRDTSLAELTELLDMDSLLYGGGYGPYETYQTPDFEHNTAEFAACMRNLRTLSSAQAMYYSDNHYTATSSYDLEQYTGELYCPNYGLYFSSVADPYIWACTYHESEDDHWYEFGYFDWSLANFDW